VRQPESARGVPWFALYVAVIGVFVWVSSRRLPPLVASHFGAAGVPNGYMTRTVYAAFMLAFVIALPAFMVAVGWYALGRAGARLNVPNRDYWLAPERRAATVAGLRTGILWFGVLLVTFLGYVHGLVVQANELVPPRLSQPWFIGGFVAFFVLLFIALGSFRRRFRAPG
jgi:hypothetical protein